MKRLHITLAVLFAAMGVFVSCNDDDSSYGDGNTNIIIQGYDKKYEVTSFAGEYLEINPQISSSFQDDDLEYAWMLYEPNHVNMGGTYNATKVSDDRNLKYEMNLLDGKYAFYLEVTSKTTGYSQRSEIIEVVASSILSKGFYVLKENTDGNTDVDLYSTIENTVYADLLNTRAGSALKGKPRSLDVIPLLCYVNPTDGEKAGGTCISVTTESDEVKWYRILDMMPIKDETNSTYDKVEGRKP